MMMEITFKTLDRVTVNGLYNKNTVADITNFAYCVEDNTYYLLDDPIVLQKREDIEVIENGYYKIVIKDKDETKVSIVTCNTLKEVYKQLINRLAKNDLNPFILYKKFKEGYVTGNVEIDSILVSTDIPDDVIEEMIEDIAKAEKNHPEMLIYISIDILKGIDEVLKKIKENQELLKDSKHMTIKDIINDLTVKGDNYIAYPRKHTLVKFIEELINDEKKKLERLMKKQEQRQQQTQQQQQGTTNQSSSGQQQRLEGGSTGSNGSDFTAGSNVGTNTSAGMQGLSSHNTGSSFDGSNNNNNNNNNGSNGDNIGSDSGSVGSSTGSLQLYTYTLRIISPYSISRTKLNDIVAYIKRVCPDVEVEAV